MGSCQRCVRVYTRARRLSRCTRDAAGGGAARGTWANTAAGIPAAGRRTRGAPAEDPSHRLHPRYDSDMWARIMEEPNTQGRLHRQVITHPRYSFCNGHEDGGARRAVRCACERRAARSRSRSLRSHRLLRSLHSLRSRRLRSGTRGNRHCYPVYCAA